MNSEQFPLSPADQVRCMNALLAQLPDHEARALLQVARWMATERTSHDPVTKEMVVGWVRDILAAGGTSKCVQQRPTLPAQELIRSNGGVSCTSSL